MVTAIILTSALKLIKLCVLALENTILYGDEKGCLVVWNFGKETANKYFPDGAHQQISCIVCSQHYQNLVAVGYKSGAVSIVDFRNRGMVII